jgi:hypothetical protein
MMERYTLGTLGIMVSPYGLCRYFVIMIMLIAEHETSKVNAIGTKRASIVINFFCIMGISKSPSGYHMYHEMIGINICINTRSAQVTHVCVGTIMDAHGPYVGYLSIRFLESCPCTY